MRQKYSYLIIFILLPIIFVSSGFLEMVSAESWWGKGAKPQKWILENGGSLIRFEIYNRSGDALEYKAILTRDKKNIEVEIGKEGIFDDALPGEYKVTFYRGGNKQKTFEKKGKDVGSIKLNVHAGEQIWLKFNYEKRKIYMTTDYVEPAPKTQKKIASVPKEDIESSSEQEILQSELNEIGLNEDNSENSEAINRGEEAGLLIDKKYPFDNISRFDLYIKNTENQVFIKPTEEALASKQESFFQKIIFSIKDFFKQVF